MDPREEFLREIENWMKDFPTTESMEGRDNHRDLVKESIHVQVTLYIVVAFF